VWKLEKKWNSSVSPTSAVKVLGEKTSPLSPTLIWTIFATALPAIKARAPRGIDECIVSSLRTFGDPCFVVNYKIEGSCGKQKSP
jgi:hypothetical protein